MADDEDTDERAARLLARSEGMQEQVARRRQALDWAEGAAAAVQGTASSADGSVHATVDQTGLLTGLQLGGPARRASDAELARVITTVVRQAAADARSRVADVYRGLVNERVLGDLPPHVLPAPEVAGQAPGLRPASPPARPPVAPPPEHAAGPGGTYGQEPRRAGPVGPGPRGQHNAGGARRPGPVDRAADDEPEEEMSWRYMKKGWH